MAAVHPPAGAREALLVDTFLSEAQTSELADWIARPFVRGERNSSGPHEKDTKTCIGSISA